MTRVGVSLQVRAMVSGSAAPRHMGRWPGKGGDRRLFNCFVLSLYILYSSRFLVLVLLANCIQNMLASCPLVCDIENVKKSPCRDVRVSCEDIPPPGIIRHSIRFLHSLTAKLAILRAQQTVMCSALSLPISQTTNYIIRLYLLCCFRLVSASGKMGRRQLNVSTETWARFPRVLSPRPRWSVRQFV